MTNFDSGQPDEFDWTSDPEGVPHDSDSGDMPDPYEAPDIIPYPDDAFDVEVFTRYDAPEQNPYPLTDWEAAESLGRIDGMRWVRPTGDPTQILTLEALGGTVTDDDLLMFGSGIEQDIELFQLPGGFHYCQVVESNTGITLTGLDVADRYAGPQWTREGIIKPTVNALTDRTIVLPGLREVSTLETYPEGTETTIHSGIDALGQTDRVSRVATYARIMPAEQKLYIQTYAPTAALESLTPHRVYGSLNIQQAGADTRGTLGVTLTGEDDQTTGQIYMGLNGAGDVDTVTVYREGLVDALGLEVETAFSETGEWVVADPAVRQKIADKLSNALGLGPWKGVDLRASASQLYEKMGSRDLDPLSIIMPRQNPDAA